MRRTKDNMIVAALLGCMVLAAILVIYLPQSKTLGELKINIATEKADLEAKSKQAVVVPGFLRHINALKNRYKNFHTRLPKRKELGGFLKEISKLLAGEDLTTRQFQSGTPSEEELFNTLPINMRLKGSYRSLGGLLKNINGMKRFTRVQRLVLIKPPPKPGREDGDSKPEDELEIELQLNIYFITEGGESDNGPQNKI